MVIYLDFMFTYPKNFFSANVARTLTFIINGMYHDIVVSIIIGRFFYTVTILLIFYAVLLIVEDKLKIKMKSIFSSDDHLYETYS